MRLFDIKDVFFSSYSFFLLFFFEISSSIHSHSDAHCFMKVLDGTLKESLFAWPENSKKKNAMTQLAANTYERDQVAYINGMYFFLPLLIQ